MAATPATCASTAQAPTECGLRLCAYELAQVVHVTLDLHTGAGSSCLLGCASARAAAASVFISCRCKGAGHCWAHEALS